MLKETKNMTSEAFIIGVYGLLDTKCPVTLDARLGAIRLTLAIRSVYRALYCQTKIGSKSLSFGQLPQKS